MDLAVWAFKTAGFPPGFNTPRTTFGPVFGLLKPSISASFQALSNSNFWWSLGEFFDAGSGLQGHRIWLGFGQDLSSQKDRFSPAFSPKRTPICTSVWALKPPIFRQHSRLKDLVVWALKTVNFPPAFSPQEPRCLGSETADFPPAFKPPKTPIFREGLGSQGRRFWRRLEVPFNYNFGRVLTCLDDNFNQY
ncbi:hypothetical protein BJ508DRAFT_169280 [Ascobolus immersus RN42]|uniref:Uncharacterized protein n=1 Tax=Ascobolus immersus RN42 TaxID=1160509 RepID=A0A3N4HYH9_ASCIM|nr:hypothetical protein BJ508DRAFT_169280 [Ascobolus immersus RN42]